MKKTIMFLGYVFLALIVIFGTVITAAVVMGKRLDRESRAYVDNAIPAIAAQWDIREVEQRASPEFNDDVDYDQLADYFDSLRDLGELKEYRGAEGDSNITLSLQNGYEITADYTADVDFESGSMEIRISLIKHGKQWQILDLQINPEEYSERKDVT